MATAIGIDGDTGDDGVGPGQAGGDGTAGQSVTASAASVGDLANTAQGHGRQWRRCLWHRTGGDGGSASGCGLAATAGFASTALSYNDKRRDAIDTEAVGATKPQGSDLAIALDANKTALLKNVTLPAFSSADATFV